MAERGSNTTIIFLVLIVVAVGVTVAALAGRLRTDEVAVAAEQGEIIRTLVVAADGDDVFLSFILFLHPGTNRIAILDIPANVGGVLSSLGRVDAIGRTFAQDDPSRYRSELESLTGVSIPYVLTFSRESLAGFIDLLGGVEMFIVTDYRNVGNEDPVLLPAGNVVLDGSKAVDFLRISEPGESELEATGRRQSFVQSLLRAMQRSAELMRHPEVTDVRDRILDGEIDRRTMSSLFAAWEEMDVERLIRRRVQGTVRTVDVEGQQIQLLFPHFEGQWLQQSVDQIETTLASGDIDANDRVTVVLEILNGTTASGMARRTSQLFEDFGFEVQRFGNAESNQIEHTVVIDRRGVGDRAQRVAQVIEAARIVTEVSPQSDVDVTLILGRDFDGTVVRDSD